MQLATVSQHTYASHYKYECEVKLKEWMIIVHVSFPCSERHWRNYFTLLYSKK